jgi:hypothetical protein
MIAAPVQCDVDGVPKGSHFARVPAIGGPFAPLILANLVAVIPGQMAARTPTALVLRAE